MPAYPVWEQLQFHVQQRSDVSSKILAIAVKMRVSCCPSELTVWEAIIDHVLNAAADNRAVMVAAHHTTVSNTVAAVLCNPSIYK